LGGAPAAALPVAAPLALRARARSRAGHAMHIMPPPRRKHHRERLITTVLVALTRILERVDEQLLPSVYYGVSVSLCATPSQLGAITFARLLVQALASPLGGVLGLRFHRGRVSGAACFAWALCCALFACVTSFPAAAAVWAVNGVGLAVLVPNAQGLIADLYPARERGRAFGMLLGVGHAGAMVATLFAGSVGNARVRLGGGVVIVGWRLAFFAVGVFSALVGALTWRLAHDPRDEGWGDPDDEDQEDELQGQEAKAPPLPPHPDRPHHPHPHQNQSLASLLDDARRVCSVPSFLVIVSQGVLGSTPWSALAYMTLYLQLRGFSDASASACLAAFSAASALGSVIGGFAGDAAAKPFPDHGRVAVCQISVLSGVPLAAMLFRAVPPDASKRAAALTVALLVSKGLLTQWAATAANNPIFSEVVEPRLRTVVYSLDRAFEGALAALGAPLVGRAAESLFGFGGGGGGEGGGSGAATAARCGDDGPPATAATGGAFARHEPDRGRADALASAMLLFTTVPWLLCALVYSLLHVTYPRDKRRAAAEREAAAARGGGGGGLLSAARSGGRRRQDGAVGWAGVPTAEEDEEADEEGRRADRVLGGGGGGGGQEEDGVEMQGRLLGGQSATGSAAALPPPLPPLRRT
jgi:predicted MFS family arabinose efflux permease